MNKIVNSESGNMSIRKGLELLDKQIEDLNAEVDLMRSRLQFVCSPSMAENVSSIDRMSEKPSSELASTIMRFFDALNEIQTKIENINKTLEI